MAKALLGGGLIFLFVFTLVGEATAQEWIQLAPTSGPPAVRNNHAAVFDPGTNQMILFGGATPAPPHLNDVWRLSDANGIGTPAWIGVTPAGSPPVPRFVHKAANDQANDRMIVFGGGLGFSSPCTNEVCVLADASGSSGTPTWTQLFPSGLAPAPRFAHSVVYDPTSNSLIVFGGSDCFISPAFGDVWVLSNANGLGGTPTWTLLSPGGVSFSRSGHTAVYDAANNRMIVFAGDEPPGTGGDLTNDVFVLTNANGLDAATPVWSLLAPSGGPPHPIEPYCWTISCWTNQPINQIQNNKHSKLFLKGLPSLTTLLLLYLQVCVYHAT